MGVQIRNTTNLTVEQVKEIVSDPATPPPTGYRFRYAKADGQYEMDHDGNVTGPFGAGGIAGVIVDLDDSPAGGGDEFNFKQGGGIAILFNQGSPSDPMDITIIQAGKVVAKTADYTLDVTDSKILCDTSGGGFTVTLPPAISAQAGQPFTVKKISSDGNTLTLDGDGTETIDGATTKTITSQWDGLTVYTDNDAWFILK